MPVGAVLGTAFGSLIGLLGGPVGLAVGAVGGLAAGGVADLNNVRIGEDFLDDVTKVLLPNKVVVVAEIDEDWTMPVDTCMEPLEGTVFRRALSEVKHTIHEGHITAMKTDLAQLKAEQAKAHADRKAKLQEKIKRLDSKIQLNCRRPKTDVKLRHARRRPKPRFSRPRLRLQRPRRPRYIFNRRSTLDRPIRSCGGDKSCATVMGHECT